MTYSRTPMCTRLVKASCITCHPDDRTISHAGRSPVTCAVDGESLFQWVPDSFLSFVMSCRKAHHFSLRGRRPHDSVLHSQSRAWCTTVPPLQCEGQCGLGQTSPDVSVIITVVSAWRFRRSSLGFQLRLPRFTNMPTSTSRRDKVDL